MHHKKAREFIFVVASLKRICELEKDLDYCYARKKSALVMTSEIKLPILVTFVQILNTSHTIDPIKDICTKLLCRYAEDQPIATDIYKLMI